MATAAVTASNGGAYDEAAGAQSFANGVTSVAVTVTFNTGILWAAGNIDETSILLSGTTALNGTAATNNAGSPASNAAHFGGKATFTFALTTTEYVNYPTAGSSTVTIDANDVTSLMGNGSAKHTVTIN